MTDFEKRRHMERMFLENGNMHVLRKHVIYQIRFVLIPSRLYEGVTWQEEARRINKRYGWTVPGLCVNYSLDEEEMQYAITAAASTQAGDLETSQKRPAEGPTLNDEDSYRKWPREMRILHSRLCKHVICQILYVLIPCRLLEGVTWQEEARRINERYGWTVPGLCQSERLGEEGINYMIGMAAKESRHLARKEVPAPVMP